MKCCGAIFLAITLSLFFSNSHALENLLGTPMAECLNCLCHARSGCWSRFNCARYSISKEYWQEAGSHCVGSCDDSDQAYKVCLNDENCILNTIKSYTEHFGDTDCNCDGTFDCKDRMAIHLFGGGNCINPRFGDVYSTRFNHCSKQISVPAMGANELNCQVDVY